MNYKTIVVPVVGVLAITSQLVFGVELPEALQEDITNVVLNAIAVGAVVYGIIKNHK